MLILRTNAAKGKDQSRDRGRVRRYLEVVLLENGSIDVYDLGGKLSRSDVAGIVTSHGGITGVLLRCHEFQGTLEEFASSIVLRNSVNWDALDARMQEFMEYQKSLPKEVVNPAESVI